MIEATCACGVVSEESDESGAIITTELDFREMELSLAQVVQDFVDAPNKALWARNYFEEGSAEGLDGADLLLAVIESVTPRTALQRCGAVSGVWAFVHLQP